MKNLINIKKPVFLFLTLPSICNIHSAENRYILISISTFFLRMDQTFFHAYGFALYIIFTTLSSPLQSISAQF